MDNQKSKIITFYSYKGGVGRSMALANVAWLLANKYNKKVLGIDWDLEAPGLHRFFDLQEKRIKKGLIDLYCDYKELLQQEAPSTGKKRLSINLYLDQRLIIDEYIVKIPEKELKRGSISFIPAGKFDKEYAKKVTEFNWEDFYENWHGFGFTEYLKAKFKSKADLILLDSRTGVTDIGGICTLQLPDVVVLLFSLNEQNISGTEMIIENILDKAAEVTNKKSPPKLILIPSRVERYLEQESRNYWEKIAADRLGQYLPERDRTSPLKYIKKKNIPQVGYFSFGEMLAVKKDPEGELSESYEDLTTSVLKTSRLWEEKVKPAAKIPSAPISPVSKKSRTKTIIIILISLFILSIPLSYQLFFKKDRKDITKTQIELGNSYMSLAEIKDRAENLNKAINV
ncbi:MAG: AAA family ATPase, partial [bacterium]